MGLVGCDKGDASDIKDEVKYESDASYHWTVANDGSTSEKEKHTLALDESKGTPATCAEKGEKVEVCSVCGYEKKTSIAKKTHNYVEDAASSTASTCKVAGEKVEKCSVCNDVKKTPLALLDHTYVEDATQAVVPTCSVVGKKVEKCSVCNDVKATEIPRTAHTLGAGTAKTDDKGREYTEFECSECHQTVSTKIAFNTYEDISGTFAEGKIAKDGGKIGWTFQLPAGDYDVFFEAKFSSSSGGNRTFATRQVVVTYNGNNVEYDTSKTAEDVGMNSSEYKACTFFTITATGGVDKMTMQNPNYRLVFDTEGYIVFKPVATVA